MGSRSPHAWLVRPRTITIHSEAYLLVWSLRAFQQRTGRPVGPTRRRDQPQSNSPRSTKMTTRHRESHELLWCVRNSRPDPSCSPMLRISYRIIFFLRLRRLFILSSAHLL